MGHTYDPSTQEVETGRSEDQGQSRLHETLLEKEEKMEAEVEGDEEV